MQKIKSSDYKVYSKFLDNLAKKLTKFYYSKLKKPFKITNKLKGKGYDPVTTADRALNTSEKTSYVSDNGKKRILKVNKTVKFSDIKMAAAFHGYLSLSKQKKIPKILKLMQFPCADALSYCHLSEGKIDVVLQCSNKIWDIHPVIPIMKAAGAVVTTWNNEDPIQAGNIICSTNKTIHKKILKILKPVSKY